MVLHIALNGELNDDLLEHLKAFYTKKEYNVLVLQDQVNTEVKCILNRYNLTIPELLLLRAFNRSFSYHLQNYTDYDLVFWNGSIIDDYEAILDTGVKKPFIKQINHYTPTFDLYITVGEPTANTPPKYNHFNIYRKKPEELFEEIVKTIFDNLPRCQWCQRLFKPDKNHYKYCDRIYKGKTCSEYGWEENNRRNNREQYHKYKNTKDEKQKYGLGSKNAYLSGTPEENPLAELEKVRKAKKSLGLRIID